MSGRPNRRERRATIEVVYTRDAKAPIVADDWDFDYGWRCIPLPPTLNEDWIIWDDTHDRRTGWIRAPNINHLDGGTA